MTTALRKAIMKRSELKNKYVKNKTNENLKSYKKTGISVVNYVRKRGKNMKCLV